MNKTLQITPTMLLGIIGSILPIVIGGIWTASDLYTRHQVTEERSEKNSEAIANFEATDTSALQERIASLEAKISSLEEKSTLINNKIDSTETSLSNYMDNEVDILFYF